MNVFKNTCVGVVAGVIISVIPWNDVIGFRNVNSLFSLLILSLLFYTALPTFVASLVTSCLFIYDKKKPSTFSAISASVLVGFTEYFKSGIDNDSPIGQFIRSNCSFSFRRYHCC